MGLRMWRRGRGRGSKRGLGEIWGWWLVKAHFFGSSIDVKYICEVHRWGSLCMYVHVVGAY